MSQQKFLRSSLSILVFATLGIFSVVPPTFAQTQTIQERFLSQEYFVRGGFNGWGTDNPLQHQGGNIYVANIMVPPGYHGFKIALKDWGITWVANAEKSVSMSIDKEYVLDEQNGPDNILFVKKTALYQFTFDLSHPPHAKLTVRKSDAAPPPAIDPHVGHAKVVKQTFSTFDGGEEQVTFSVDDLAAPLRRYTQSTTIELRDPGANFVHYHESPSLPYIRTGNLAFDALFALAGDELKKNSVSEIRDGNYNGGNAIPCNCFETGEKWHYVWTRDLSYAAHLGLSLVDPERVRNSLEFKLSGFRPEVSKASAVAGDADGFQIAQDTGSGGSWPVSTDRVTWAFGAESALHTLPTAERQAFAIKALRALENTIENDRIAAFDRRDGLYSGEQSFLDWRDQTYASWIVNDIASLASAKALSTNVAHYKALRLAAELAQQQGEVALHQKYSSWADQLSKAINHAFWLEDQGLYSSLTAGHLNGAALHKFDWLGQSLAIITGVADASKTAKILAHYPHGPMGAPVIYPQQPNVPIYHNRAIWPFVTAYGLRAAAIGGNTKVADAAYHTLIRGASLNLSNMENLEWLTAQAVLLDEKNPALIGPVINSKRQLWSVGAYLGMVVENVFGISVVNDGITVKPFITSTLRREQFAETNVIELSQLQLMGKAIQVRIHLPAASKHEGYYAVESIQLNQQPTSSHITWDKLSASNVIEVKLGSLVKGSQTIHAVNADPYENGSLVFAPQEAQLQNVQRTADGRVHLTIVDGRNAKATHYNIFRNGKLLAEKLPVGKWIDTSHAPIGSTYAVEAVTSENGNRAHHSAPAFPDKTLLIPAAAFDSNIKLSPADARHHAPYLKDWGKPTDQLRIKNIQLEKAGRYQFQFQYLNTYNEINLGISCGVKWAVLKDQSGKIVAQGVIQLPHTKLESAQSPAFFSTPLVVDLIAGAYQLELLDFMNMSYLKSNSSFTNAGGSSGEVNRFDIYGLRLLGLISTP